MDFAIVTSTSPKYERPSCEGLPNDPEFCLVPVAMLDNHDLLGRTVAMPPAMMVMAATLLDDDGFGFGLGRDGHGHSEANGGKGG